MRGVPLGVLALALLTYVACQDSPTSFDLIPGPEFLISDAVHSDGNEHFFWLPPMVVDPGTFNGPFDGSVSPSVRVEQRCVPPDCGTAPIAEYTTETGPGSETVRLSAADEHYIVNWHTDEFSVTPGPTYRISVRVAGTELGFADVQLASTGKEIKNLTTNEIIGLKDGRTLPIKFRIEEGAVFVISAQGGTIQALDGQATIDIPFGAVTDDVGITVESLSPTGGQVVVVELGPAGLQFDPNNPVTVTLAYDPAALGGVDEADLALNLLDEVTGEWNIVPGFVLDTDNNEASAPFFHFSQAGVGPANRAVFCPGDTHAFDSLRDALDAVVTGGTVVVCDGIHAVEGVVVDRPVTIRAKGGATPTLATSAAEETLLVGGYATGTVLIDGLTFAMTAPTASGFYPYAIRATDPYDQLVVRNVTLDIDPASRGGVRVMATTVDGGGVTLDGSTVTGGARGADVTGSRLDVVNSDFSGFSQWALLYRTPAGQSGRIESSTFASCGKWQCVGGFFSDLEIVSNTFTAPTPTGDTNIDPTSHINIGTQSTALIDDNDFVGCGYGSCVFGGGTEAQLTVTNNRLTSNGADASKHAPEHRMIVQGSTGYSGAGGLIENNEITGCLYTCIEVRERVGTTTVRGNTLTLPAGEPAWHGILGWGGLDPDIGVLPPPEDRPQLAIEHNTIRALGAPEDPTNWDAYELKWGITLSNAVATTVTGNLIENAAIGIGSVEGSDLQNGTDNTIQGVQSGIYLDGGGVEWDEGRATLNSNDITDYYSSIVGKGGSTASDLRCNYWGGGEPLNRTENGGPIPVTVYTPWVTSPVAGTGTTSCDGGMSTVGSAGGTINEEGGAVVLDVPAGALTSDVGVIINPSTSFPTDQGLITGAVFDFQPEGTAFSTPATLTLAYDEANLGDIPENTLTLLTEEVGEWVEAEGATVDENANTVTGLVDGFSKKGAGGKVTTVDVTPPSATLEIGETVQLTGEPKNAAGNTVNRKVTWKSLDDLMATVDNTGLVTAVAPGTVTIEGKSGGASGLAEVTVLSPDPCAGVVITFEDANLEAAVREREDIPDSGPITGEMAQAATGTLDIQARQIASLEGLQCFTGITSLLMPHNQVTDLTPIAGLTNLHYLEANSNLVADVAPLLGLTGLRSVNLSAQSISDPTPLSEMTWLEGLSMGATNLNDLSFLSGMTSLRVLDVRENSITDVTPLANLTGLTRLEMHGGSIGASASTLGDLSEMVFLRLSDMGLSDIGFIGRMNSLRVAVLSGNSFSDLAPLGGLGGLEELAMDGVPQLWEADLSPLGELTGLVRLYIRDANLGDLSFLNSTMTQLGILRLSGNSIEDAMPILDLGSLTDLGLSANPITCDDPFFDQLAAQVTFTCNEAPVVYITAPADATTVVQGEEITFTGNATDPEDGTLPDGQLAWSSDPDGSFGSGGSITTSTLSVGDHQITLEGMDTHGGTGTAAIILTVAPAEPPAILAVGDILASMLDEQGFQSRYGTDWVLADGRSVAGSAYQGLTGLANVPDLRAMFLLGLNQGGARAVGTTEDDDVGRHNHSFNVQPKGDNYVGGGNAPGWRPSSFNPQPMPQNNLVILPTGGAETRPKNVAVYFYIRVHDESADLTLHEIGVGDIVPSMLDEQQFQSEHGAEWVLADGRSAGGSVYQATTGFATVPDLRAMFLRGVNGSRSDGWADPGDDVVDVDGNPVQSGSPRPVGSLQLDAFASHGHEFNVSPLGDNYVGGGNAPGWRPSSFNPSPIPSNDLHIRPQGESGLETRPNNTAFFFYIRIKEGSPGTIRDQVAIGDIVTSLLGEQAFQSQHGSGWVPADGRYVSGTPYEAVTGFSRVPDLGGKFLRGVEGTRTEEGDPGEYVVTLDGIPVPSGSPRPVGSAQFHTVGAHSHGLSIQPLGDNYVGGGNAPGWRPSSFNPSPMPENNLRILPGTGETRPNNVGVYFYIRVGEY